MPHNISFLVAFALGAIVGVGAFALGRVAAENSRCRGHRLAHAPRTTADREGTAATRSGVAMTKQELIKQLKALANSVTGDEEEWHFAADQLLLDFINDPDVTETYEAIPKWYS